MTSHLLLALSLVAVAGGPAASQGTGQSPDFSNVDDILSGRRLILPVEDLVLASGAAGNDTILQTNDSTVTQLIPFDPGGTPLALASGRVFDLEDDVVITMVEAGGNNSINLRDAVGQRSLTLETGVPVCSASCSSNLLVTGDLTGDGYDEIVLAYAGGGLQVVTAVDVSDFDKGLAFGPLFEGSPVVQPQAMTVADFSGKGRGALAVADLPDLEVYQLDTTDNASATGLTLVRIATAPFDTPPSGVTSAQLSAGQFDDDAKDLELILMLAADNLLSGYFIQMSDASMPTIGDLQSLDIPADIIGQESGRLDWFGDRDQLVVTADWSGRSLAFLFVLAPIDGNLASAVAGGTQTGFAGCTDGKQSRVYDVALGDFDFDLEDPASTPPNLEIGILAACEGDGVQQLQWQIFKVDPSNGTFPTKLVASGNLQERSLPTTPVVSALVASDTQGRSLLLGPPTKVVINDYSQPRIVMGAPPMHIDFIQHPTDPGQPSTSFGKINMTAFPATDDNTDRGMNGEFDLASSSTVQNSSTQTTSYSYATGDAADANVGLGIPDVFSLGASIKRAAETTHANFVQNQVGSYDSSSYSLQTITGFGDVIWFNTKRFNIWVYRVLGHFACPSDDPKCDSSLPLNLVFSGPDKIINQPHTPATQVEWYQPHHEVGNILSYPQTLDQLASALGPNSDLQQFFDTSFTTGSNSDTQTLTWSSGQTSAQSTGSAKTHSQRLSESVGGDASYFLFAGEGGTFDQNQSSGLSTLESTIDTMASTNGFTITVPSFNLGEDYSYPFNGYILGDSPNESVLQQQALIDELKNKDMVDKTVLGILRLAFTAQPDEATGVWWSNTTAPYLSAPDVALNHPVRWTKIAETSGPLSSVYCFNILDRGDVLKGGGYEMKGLFVLPEGTARGPVLTVANEGQKLSIQARIYNYSRLDMTADQEAVAQIYAQEWDVTSQSFVGDAFLVGEQKLGPIPGNRASNSGLNSKFATATFDTGDCPLSGGCGGKYLKFWVVAWIEDASGRLVADYEDHGLRRKPTGNLTSIGQVAVEPISNNVGFWDQEIYICPKDAQCTTAAATLPSDAFSIDELALSADRADTFETLEVSARLRTGAQGVGGILLLFFDGDPNDGGTIFEVEHVPFVAANSTYLSRVRYQPLVSGPHDIYVVARSGDLVISKMAGLQAFDPPDTTPKCQNPLDNVSDMTGHAGRLGATDRDGSVRVRATLSGIGPIDLDTSVVTIDRLLHEVGGLGELVRSRSDADFLPLTLAAGRGSKADLGRFDTGPGSSPRVRLTLRRLAEDTLQMSLRAHGASLPEVPQLCKGSPRTTTLSTRLLSIDDGVHPVVAAPMTATWRCETDRLGRVYLNARSPVL